MYIRMSRASPEKVIHQIPKHYAVVKQTSNLHNLRIGSRYWIGILVREEKNTYLVQTYGYCEDCSKSVFAKFTPKYMKGPIGKLP